jgi:hydroxymethylglutaryl-CoA reductase
MKSSKISGFYKLSPKERLQKLKEFANLTEEEAAMLSSTGAFKLEQADRMIENVVGTMEIPFGVATNFQINNKEYLIPMVIEEPSVVAAASNSAKMALGKGGFRASSDDPVMIGQIQITSLSDPLEAIEKIKAKKQEIINLANSKDSMLVKLGGGVKNVTVRVMNGGKEQPMVIVHLHVNCLDAMGANAVNTMAEAVAPMLEETTGGKVFLRIITNLATDRLARAEAIYSKEALGGEEVVDAILNAYLFADKDPYRACTHNKGIMNGISAVVLATGNDTRAVEAGAHAYAAISGQYRPLTKWEKTQDGDLKGSIELPIAVGLVGGATKVHPTAQVAVKILGVEHAQELAEIIAAVGLAQNLAAMKALATEGIQKGHMALHARNIAATAGAKGPDIDKIADQMAEEKKISVSRAKELLEGKG